MNITTLNKKKDPYIALKYTLFLFLIILSFDFVADGIFWWVENGSPDWTKTKLEKAKRTKGKKTEWKTRKP